MAEYITKKQAQDILCIGCNKDLHFVCRCDKWAEIRRTDGIDIVHCSECKYWENGTMDLGLDCHTRPDFFCADGERKPALKHADEETLQSAT